MPHDFKIQRLRVFIRQNKPVSSNLRALRPEHDTILSRARPLLLFTGCRAQLSSPLGCLLNSLCLEDSGLVRAAESEEEEGEKARAGDEESAN